MGAEGLETILEISQQVFEPIIQDTQGLSQESHLINKKILDDKGKNLACWECHRQVATFHSTIVNERGKGLQQVLMALAMANQRGEKQDGEAWRVEIMRDRKRKKRIKKKKKSRCRSFALKILGTKFFLSILVAQIICIKNFGY